MNNSLQIRRIQNEVVEMKKNPSDMYVASPLENDLRTWHFTIRGPKESEFEEGIYHGKIELSSEYPIKPPNLYFLTPNGRFEVNTKICLNITKFHKESWNPAFTIRTMIEALINYFPIREEGFAGVGALDYPSEERKKLAILSQKTSCDKCGPLNQILPVLKKKIEKQEEKKEETEKIEESAKNQKKEEKNADEKEEVEIMEEHDEKLKDKLEDLRESIKQQQAKLKLPFLQGSSSLNDFQRKKQNERTFKNAENEKTDSKISFDNVLTEINLLQEVVKSIKFTKHPLNHESKPANSNPENEKTKENEIPKNPEKNEILIPEQKISADEGIKHLNTTTEEKKNENNLEENKIIEEKPEVVQAKHTLKVFDTIIRVVQTFVVVSIIAYIYS